MTRSHVARIAAVTSMVATSCLTSVVAAPAAHATDSGLVTSITVDRAVARPGDRITYTVRVDNLGPSSESTVQISAHYPRSTTASSTTCPRGTIEPNGDVCVHPEVPTPGAGDSAHQVNGGRSPLAAGDGFTLTFAVTVDAGTPVGTHLPNHAHVTTLTQTIDTPGVNTVVVGAEGDAFAGSSAVRLTGGVTTDSYASLADYSPANGGDAGHLASNGPIELGGSIVVRGDARPGPGQKVTTWGGAVVTGSSASAATAFELGAIDADAFSDGNSNALLCRQAADCSGATFDRATATLIVPHGGSVRLGPGSYFLCGLDLRGPLIADGRVNVWIGSAAACPAGPYVSLRGGGALRAASGRSRELALRIGSNGAGIELGANTASVVTIDAPTSSVRIGGGAQLFGRIFAGTLLSGSGGGALHLDRSP